MSRDYIKCRLTLDTKEEYETLIGAVRFTLCMSGFGLPAKKCLKDILEALLAHEASD